MRTRRVSAKLRLLPPLSAAVIHRTADALWLDVDSPHYSAAALSRALRAHERMKPRRPTMQPARTTPVGGVMPIGAHWGTALWSELHSKVMPGPAWLAEWRSRIGCQACLDEYDRLAAADPPEFGAGWFAWTVRMHNAVNRKLGRAAFTVGQARRRWFGVDA